MDPVSLAREPWAVVVAIGIGLATGFVRGWLVPGFIYRREVRRSDEASKALIAFLSKTRPDDDGKGG